MIEIHSNPTFDEIWDICVRNFLYNQDKYVNEILALFERIGITKESKIADISVGGGFPAINLIKLGYKIDCFGAFSRELFDKNSELAGLDIKCSAIFWKDIALPEYARPL